MLDGHKSMPSRERMCPGTMPEGVCSARWTQIDAIARADVLYRPLEWRLPCQMICRNRGQRAITICGNGEHRCTGGLAPIIEIRFSGPPESGSLRRDGVGTCSDETKPNLHLAPQKLCPQNRGYSWTKWHFERFCPRNRPFSWTKSSQ